MPRLEYEAESKNTSLRLVDRKTAESEGSMDFL